MSITVKKLIALLEGSTKNPNAEIVFKDSNSTRIMIGSESMCRHCEKELILSVPINK